MTDKWLFKSETFDNCNCAINCGCQFNLPTTYGKCESAYVGEIVEGHFRKRMTWQASPCDNARDERFSWFDCAGRPLIAALQRTIPATIETVVP